MSNRQIEEHWYHRKTKRSWKTFSPCEVKDVPSPQYLKGKWDDKTEWENQPVGWSNELYKNERYYK